MGRKRKITPEIARFIRRKHRQGHAWKELGVLVKEEFRIHVSLSSITRYYRPLHVVREEVAKYNERRKAGENRTKMRGRRKVTPEIAEFIREKHSEGCSYGNIYNLVQELYSIQLHPNTICRYYRPLQEVIEKRREAHRRGRAGRGKKAYNLRYHRFIRHLQDYILKAFNDNSRLSAEGLSNRLAELALEDSKISRRIYLKPQTLDTYVAKLQMKSNGACPVYESKIGEYALKRK